MKTIIYLLVLLLSSCVQETYLASPADYPYFHSPNILDNFREGQTQFETKNMIFPENQILFSGTLSDTINLNLYKIPLNQHLESTPLIKKNEVPEGLQITVCQTQNMAMFSDYDSIPPAPKFRENSSEIDSLATLKDYNKWISRKRNLIQAIPVFIYNSGIKTILLEQHDEKLTMIQEAMDEKGIWRPIEYWIVPRCGYRRSPIELLPNGLVFTRVIRYKGNFATDLRLKLRSNLQVYYSNSYRGTIHKSQFNLPERIKRNYSEDGKLDKYASNMFFLNY